MATPSYKSPKTHPAVAAIQKSGAPKVKVAVSDIDDRASRLHRRHDVGILSRGTYHSVDTGKFTLGPAMAIDVADRVRAQ